MTTNHSGELQEAALNHLWMPTQDWSDLAGERRDVHGRGRRRPHQVRRRQVGATTASPG